MTIRRFAIYWLADYVLASIVVFVLSFATQLIWNISWLASAVLFFIPFSTLFFSYFAFHKSHKGPDAKFKTALVWTVLAIIFDMLIVLVFYRANPFIVLFSPLILLIYVTKFVSVYVAAFLAHRYELKHDQQADPINFLANETPSPRS